MFLNSGVLGEGILQIFLILIATIMAIFVAMPFHEFAHALAARSQGDYTATAYKRLTLAPLAHFDKIGFIFLILFGFGWAKPVPVDSRNFKNGKKSLFLVSVAGILMNIALGIVFLFIYMLLLRFLPQVFDIKIYGFLLEEFLVVSVSLNFMLAFFNILPIYPLDGYKMLSSLSREENGFLIFMKRYSIIIYLLFTFSGLYYIYYSYTAGLLMDGLINLFSRILGL